MPTLRGVRARRPTSTRCAAAAEDIGFPLFVKAVAGGGGRGMRRVERRRATCARRVEAAHARGRGRRSATRPSSSSRPWSTRATSRCRSSPTATGNVIHLFERDCSVQRRHQKVVEIAPAPNLDPELRERICADAVALRPARSATSTPARSSSCSTRDGRYVFIEMNPRIQVEHTVTEEVTDVDLVQSQMRIAAGETLADLGPAPGRRSALRGAALQCRITTEDPANGFRPDTGRITDLPLPRRRRRPPRRRHDVRRRRDQRPLRLDAGQAHLPRPRLRRPPCAGRAGRVAEFRIRGVATNIPFLQAVLDDPDFRAGRRHHLVHRDAPAAAHRAGQRPTAAPSCSPTSPTSPSTSRTAAAAGQRRPGQQAARDSTSTRPPPDGARAAAARGSGPEAFAARAARAAARSRSPTRRSATPTSRCWPPGCAPATCCDVAGHVARLTPQLLERRGLGRRDVRRGAALPRRGPVGAAGRAARGDAQHLPADAAARPQHGRLHAVPDRGHRRLRARGGRDRHRRLPDLRRAQRRRADAAGDRGGPRDRHGGRRGRALLHRRPVRPGREALHARLLPAAWPSGSSTPARTCWRSRTWPGCCARRPRAPWSPRCASGSTCRCTCTPTTPPAASSATLLAAIDAGVDAVDAASASMAGTTSQPALSALVAATDHTDRATGLDLAAVCDLEPYWEAMRRLYAPFESGLPSPTGRVYTHEIPGGQLSNLRQQAIALGLGREVRADRGHVRRGQPTSSATSSR